MPGNRPGITSRLSSWSLHMFRGVKPNQTKPNQIKPNLCHKETQCVLLPILLKPPLSPSAFRIFPLPCCFYLPPSALLLPHRLGWPRPPRSLIHTSYCSLSPHISSTSSLSTTCQVLQVPVPERESDWLSSPHPNSVYQLSAVESGDPTRPVSSA